MKAEKFPRSVRGYAVQDGYGCGDAVSTFILSPYIRDGRLTHPQVRRSSRLRVCAYRQRFVQVTVIPPRMGPRNMTTGCRQVRGTV